MIIRKDVSIPVIKTLAKQLKQYKNPSLLASLFSAIEVFTDIAIPLLMAFIIDRGIEAGNMQAVYLYGGLMLVTVLIGLTSGAASGKYAASGASGLSANLRMGMFKNIQTFSFSNLDKYSTAGLVTRMTTDVTNVQNAYMMLIRVGIRCILMLVFALGVSCMIAPEVSLIFLIIVAFLALALFLIIRRVMPVFKEVFENYDALNASVQENVTGIRVVKGFVREPYEQSRFKRTVEHLYKKFVKAEGTLAFNNPIMMLAIYTCMLSVSWLGAQLIVGGSLTTGELTSLFTYIMSIMMSLMMLSFIFVMVTMSYSSAHRIAEVLVEKSDIVNPQNPIMQVPDGSVDFHHVNFSYKVGKGKSVLNDINFSIKPGETVGIIGGTGSSKTSLVNLISRLYDVSDGDVLVGGINVKDYDLKVLRDQVSVVLQKNNLFSGTILENLRWGNKNATEEACIAACKMACAHDFIQQFPDQYDTFIEQGGSNVSGGQKQRLCIARALLKNPKVLILDDSTSAVDMSTDAKIRQALKTYLPDMTKFIIAQRIASVKDADQIILLKDGQIEALGTHDTLYATNANYQSICDSQENTSGDFDQKGGLL